MRLENILDVIDGELANSPSVSSFSGVATNLRNIKHKYLYITDDPSTIEEAIKLGAYGVITQATQVWSGEESAVIIVKDVDEAIIKLFRFWLLKSGVKRHSLSLEESIVVKTLCSKSELAVFEDFDRFEIDCFFEAPRDVVFAPSVFLNRLGIECSETRIDSLARVYASGLFSCEVYLDRVYKLNFCSLFASELASALSFMLANNYEINRSKLFDIPILEAVFLNRKIERVEFGKSSRVALCEGRSRTFNRAVEFFEKNIKWGKNLYLAPLEVGVENHRVIRYANSDDLLSILKSNEFNYALILYLKESVVEIFSPKSNLYSLF